MNAIAGRTTSKQRTGAKGKGLSQKLGICPRLSFFAAEVTPTGLDTLLFPDRINTKEKHVFIGNLPLERQIHL